MHQINILYYKRKEGKKQMKEYENIYTIKNNNENNNEWEYD